MYEQIKSDLVAAMKAQEKFKLEVLRMLKSALMNEEISLGGNGSGLTDEQVLAVIKREVKKRNSSIEEYEKYGKTETVEQLKQEVEILSVYLPPEMSDEELEAKVDEIIAELGVTDIKGMGLAMKEIGARLGASADMSKVSKLVKDKLNN
jgi:hypothetical protein